MKKCKIVHGKLICEEDDIGLASSGLNGNRRSYKGSVKSDSSFETSDFDDLLDAHNIPEEHRDDIKDIFHPIIGNHITKANTQKVPKFVRTKALLAKASSVYFESGKNQQQVDSFLKKNGMTTGRSG